MERGRVKNMKIDIDSNMQLTIRRQKYQGAI